MQLQFINSDLLQIAHHNFENVGDQLKVIMSSIIRNHKILKAWINKHTGLNL